MYYDQLLFLHPFMQASAIESFFPEQERAEALQTKVPQTEIPLTKDSQTKTPQIKSPENQIVQDGENEQSSVKEAPIHVTPYSYNKRKRQQSYDEEILNMLKEEAKNKFDHDEYFLLSLASDFKQYDAKKKCLLRMELLNTVMKFHQQHMPKTESETLYVYTETPDYVRNADGRWLNEDSEIA